MGACTSKKVANQIDHGAIVSKSEINQSAHTHLKNMLDSDPMANSMNSDVMASTLQKMQKQSGKTGEESRVVDKDAS